MNFPAKAICLLACLYLGGCGWITSLWPRGQKTVPVTQPSDQGEQLAFPEPDPNGQTDAPEDPQNPEQDDGDGQIVAITNGAEQDDPDPPKDPQPEPEPVRREGREVIIAATALVVDNHFITAEDILRGAGPRLAEVEDGLSRGQFVQQAGQILRREIQTQINLALVLDRAEAELNDQQRQLLNRQLERIRKDMIASAGGSEKKLQAELAAKGTTIEAVLERQRKQIIVSSYTRAKFTDAVVITRSMLWEYYQRNIDQFSSDRKIQVRMIAAPVRAFLPENPTRQDLPEARAKAGKHIRTAAEALAAGKDFAQVARELSKGPRASMGGLWPMLEAGSIRQEKVEQVAFSLESGQVSDVIETDEGFYIVSPVEIQPGKVVSFLDAQKKIAETLRQEEVSRLRQEYYKRLQQEAVIAESQQFMDVVMAKAIERYHG
jgi:parvulin-like peptidyl-prolyl isomerase